jgi:CubicO group peptidase (beta-lactamase class C family)
MISQLLQIQIRDLASAALGKHAGIVVGILRGGDQWVAAYGRFDAGQRPPDEDAIFEIGSVTKVFTTLKKVAQFWRLALPT